MQGIIVLNKPKGVTSFKVVSFVRKCLNVKAVGHMGTLDPMAEGVLVIGVGKATRLFDFFLQKSKAYCAEFEFGYQTTTLDSEGEVEKTCDFIPDEALLRQKLKLFLGEIMQKPPNVSAKHIDGVRAYKKARSGEEFELPLSKVCINQFELLGGSHNRFNFSIDCSKGTYIRSLARDLALACGSLATMTSLTRTRCGGFKLCDAITLDELEALGESALIKVEDALSLERYCISSESARRLINGLKLTDKGAPEGNFLLLSNNTLLGIAHKTADDTIKITTFIKEDTGQNQQKEQI